MLAAAAVVLLAERSEAQSDGAYGRFERDLMLSVGAGGGVSVAPDTDPEGVVVIDARMRWLDCAGFVVAPEIRPASDARVPVCSRPVCCEAAAASRQPRPITDMAPAVIALV